MLKRTVQITDLCLEEVSYPMTKAAVVGCVRNSLGLIVRELEKIADREYLCRDEIDEDLEGPPGG